MTVAEYVAALRKNADDYHFDRIDHATFSERQRATWAAIERVPGLQSAVLRALREAA